MRRPARTRFDCRYQEHTTDQHDNRVLLWTLHHLARSPLLRASTQRELRRVVWALGPEVALEPVKAADAIRERYDRLRADYRPMHQLCLFFLLNAGPTHRVGAREVTPFVVAMPTLFELFVSEALRQRLPGWLRLDSQASLTIDPGDRVRFRIDLVIYERSSGQALMVLDTKYKDHSAPSSHDTQQVIAYAAALRCTRAALIYPSSASLKPARAGEIEVRRLAFPLDGHLDVAGEHFIREVLEFIGSCPPSKEASE